MLHDGELHIVTDMVFAKQRLSKYALHQMGALLLNGYEFLGNRIVEIRSNANTGNEILQEGVL
jgi:hypothetical protein